jgi:pyridoxine 5-phosphate synthase
MASPYLRLGVNIDHVATLRNARGGAYPDPIEAAHEAIASGADSITAHLREDRRHIRDDDIERLKREILTPLNFEIAAVPEMIAMATRVHPHAVCIVPEKREERTTEGGLDLTRSGRNLAGAIEALKDAGVRVSLFLEPDLAMMEAALALGAPVVEMHTGAYSEAALGTDAALFARELDRLRLAAAHGAELGLEIHAGHGLTVDNVGAIAAIPEVMELNIGHALIGRAVFIGLDEAVREMRAAIDAGRAGMPPDR